MTEVFNLLDGELVHDPDRAGYCQRYVRVGPKIGASKLGLSIYHLEDGERVCPYHSEWSDEEWLFVFDGSPLVRTPEGEQRLRPGDVVCFREGPEGAHSVAGPARVGMLSTKGPVGVAEYPDSDKIGLWGPDGTHYMLRRTPSLDYWDGED